MHILVTGATGFVGGHIRQRILSHPDWSLTGTTFPDAPPTATNPREHFAFIDLRQTDNVVELLTDQRPDAIIHLAAQSHVPTAYNDPWSTLENNIRGQLNLLEACVTLKIRPRFLVIGSGEEYGRDTPEAMPLREDHPLRPENPYSVSKVTQDVLGYQYAISFGIPVVRMRPFNHVGPGQSPRFVLPAFAQQIARIEYGQQKPVLSVGNLSPARDFTDVRDVVRAYELALLFGEDGEVYNVCSGVGRTIQSLVDGLLSLARVPISVEVDLERYRPADVPVIFGSAEKLHQITGWQPEIPFEATIRDVLDEWRQRERPGT